MRRTALDAYIARKAEIDTMLDRLRALSDEHFNVSPDEVDWSHVGTLAHYAELLKRITDSAFNEGEHCQRRSKNASSGRSKNASRLTA